jgi:hypothetical protein
MSDFEDQQAEAEFEEWQERTQGGTIRYVGVDKPQVSFVKQDFNMPSQFEGTDNAPNDPEQAGWEDIDE